jgi:hypothetical protein
MPTSQRKPSCSERTLSSVVSLQLLHSKPHRRYPAATAWSRHIHSSLELQRLSQRSSEQTLELVDEISSSVHHTQLTTIARPIQHRRTAGVEHRRALSRGRHQLSSRRPGENPAAVNRQINVVVSGIVGHQTHVGTVEEIRSHTPASSPPEHGRTPATTNLRGAEQDQARPYAGCSTRSPEPPDSQARRVRRGSGGDPTPGSPGRTGLPGRV